MDFINNFPFFQSSAIRSALEARGASIRKRWGQNYLIEPNTLKRIAAVLEAESGTPVLEIGPGLGGLTRELLLRGLSVYAVELDPVSCAILREGFRASRPPLFLKQADALDVLAELLKEQGVAFERLSRPKTEPQTEVLRPDTLSHICGNLPYYISSPLLEGVVRLEQVQVGVFLLQAEYAKRILSERKQSSLAIFLKNFGNWEKVAGVSARNFYPAPKVDSTLLRFRRHRQGALAPPDLLERLLRMSFLSKRKKLINSWKGDARGLLELDLLIEAARQAGISTNARPEDIEPERWYACASHLARSRTALPEGGYA